MPRPIRTPHVYPENIDQVVQQYGIDSGNDELNRSLAQDLDQLFQTDAGKDLTDSAEIWRVADAAEGGAFNSEQGSNTLHDLLRRFQTKIPRQHYEKIYQAYASVDVSGRLLIVNAHGQMAAPTIVTSRSAILDKLKTDDEELGVFVADPNGGLRQSYQKPDGQFDTRVRFSAGGSHSNQEDLGSVGRMFTIKPDGTLEQ